MDEVGAQKAPEAVEVGGKTVVMKKFPKENMKNNIGLIVLAIFVVVAGVVSGWFLAGRPTMGAKESQAPEVPRAEVTSNEAGIADESTFKDTADGKLVEGGIDGEGTHHLERDGGPSQNVYLTSTVIDLDSFVGKNVTVWGETISARKAGWLMDVGKVKVKN